MKRPLGIALAVVLVAAVVVTITVGRSSDDAPAVTTVRGVIGSEKAVFFADRRVVEAFARHGLRVEVDAAGSRQIATSVPLDRYDFAFPSSVPAAERLRRDRGVTTVYTPFSSPMAVATFEPVAGLLERAGVVRKGPGDYRVLDVAAYLALTDQGTRWDQLPGNTTYPARKNVLITTTDPRESNSAAMYLAVVSYVANGNAVVTTPAAEATVLPRVSRLFLDQGYTQSTTEGPFEDYLSAGMGKTPMVLVYESQFLDRQGRGDGTVRTDMSLLYPSPTVLSKHTLVPLREGGNRVGEVLSTDPELGRLAAEFGFRTADPRHFRDVTAARGQKVPPDLVDVVEPPSYETLERLLDAVGKQYG